MSTEPEFKFELISDQTQDELEESVKALERFQFELWQMHMENLPEGECGE